MSKLNKILAGAALAGALTAWTSAANAAMTYSMTVTGGGATGSVAAGSTITLSLFANITPAPGANPDGFFYGSGSFISTVTNGTPTGGISGVTLPNAAFSGAGNASVVGASANINADGITDWGSPNGPTSVDDTGFFMIRPNGDPLPLNTDGSGNIELARVVVSIASGSTAGSASFGFQLRNRSGLPDQLWAENYTTTTTVDGGGTTHLAGVTNTKSEETGGTVSVGTGVVLAITGAATGTPGLWDGNQTNTDWTNAANWDDHNVPTGAVTFGSATATTTVTVGTGVATPGIGFNGSGAYTISGAGGISVGASGISLAGTNNQIISTPVTFTQTAAITNNGAAGNTLTLGKVTLSGGKTLTVSVGTTVSAASLNNGSPLAGTAGSLDVEGKLTLATITGRTGGASTNLTVLDGLTVNGLLDLTNHDLLIHNATYSTILGKVVAGLGTGSWNGTTGITSGAAASAGNTGLAVVAGSDYAAAASTTLFDGMTVVSTDVVIKYTYLGDANLDGSVTFADFSKFQPNFNQPGVFGWKDGDWNYDTAVTFADFSKFQPNFNSGAPVLAGDFGIAAVPEPASITILGLASASLLVRRRGVRR